jgi:Chaperone of endosialidase
MADWWNSFGDSAQRLFVPLGGDVDNSKAPWWDIGGSIQGNQEKIDAQEAQRKSNLYGQAGAAGGFADQAQGSYGQLGGEASGQRDYLRRLASGQDSVSAEQLRQGLQQNVSAQRSMAASASPQNAAMAARTAAMTAGRAGSALAGQQAVAGLQERQSAQQALSNMILQQRQQELQAALQSRQTAQQGYSAQNAGQPQKSSLEQYGPAIMGGLTAMMSDKRVKKNIRAGDHDANKALDTLRPLTYAYKNKKHGEGKQLGTTTEDLKRAGLGQAVFQTPEGEAVHGGKLAGANTAMLAALNRRVVKLEGGKER